MEIEILEFYAVDRERNKNKKTLGTIRVRLPEIDVDILGITVTKSKDGFLFHVPSKHGVLKKTGESIRYPLINFSNRDKQRDFKYALAKTATEYMLKLTETELKDGKR